MRTHSGKDLKREAARFVSALKPRAQATIVALSGELGAGKTTFTQGIAASVGVQEAVTSPTFVIEKLYELSGQRWQRLIHIDAYRLKDSSELQVLGWEGIAMDPANLILIEWPERVADLIPEDAVRVRFDIEGEGRIITIHGESEN